MLQTERRVFSSSCISRIQKSSSLKPTKACEKFGVYPKRPGPQKAWLPDLFAEGGGPPWEVSFFFCRLLTVLPVTARGDFASAVWHQKSRGRDNNERRQFSVVFFLFPFFPSGRVTAGIACGNKLKRDGWRVVLPLLGGSIRPHHSIPIILWTVTLQPFFLFQVSFCPMLTPPPFFFFPLLFATEKGYC